MNRKLGMVLFVTGVVGLVGCTAKDDTGTTVTVNTRNGSGAMGMSAHVAMSSAYGSSMASSAGNSMENAANSAGNALENAGNAAGNALENAANKTGNAIEGGAKTIDVKAALMANTSVDADDINVDTNEAAKTVTLRGSVTTEAQKTSAEAIAKQNATGYTVKNELVIKPKT